MRKTGGALMYVSPGVRAGLPIAGLSFIRCTQYWQILRECPQSEFYVKADF